MLTNIYTVLYILYYIYCIIYTVLRVYILYYIYCIVTYPDHTQLVEFQYNAKKQHALPHTVLVHDKLRNCTVRQLYLILLRLITERAPDSFRRRS